MPDEHIFVNIIFLSNDWDGYHRKALTEQLIKELDVWSNSVLIQLPVSLFVHSFTNLRKKIYGLIGGKYKTVKLTNKSFLFTPVIIFHYLLWSKNKLFFKIDYWFLSRQINKFIKKNIGSSEVIIWYYFPYFLDFILKFDAKLKIYDQYDIHHMDISGKVNEKIKKMNDELIKNSDIVFCTTKYLQDISENINKNSFYITNGNNFEHLSSPGNVKAKINLPVENGKIIGYLGGIRDWIDFDLVNFVVSKLPDVNFLFIGHIYKTAKFEMENIQKYKNVLWIDFVQPEKLPSYFLNFDVGIIPFKNSEFFKSVFPNKFFEYLASGIPAITTNLPELKKYEKIVGYSCNKTEFLENCVKALNGSFDKYREEYLKISHENSWKVKAEEMSNIILNSIVNK